MDTDNLENQNPEPNAVFREEQKPEPKKDKPVYLQLALPVAIVLAAVLISGTILYTHEQSTPGNNNGTAAIGNKADQIVQAKITSSDHIIGNANAKVTIVEFADFRCPFCERFYSQTKDQIIQSYVNTGKAKFVFKNYAFLGQESVWAAEAAECAGEQNKYWEMFNWLFTNQAPETNLTFYSKVNLIKDAGKVSVDTTQFASCLNTDKTASVVSSDLSAGQSVGVSGTPSFLVFSNKDASFDVSIIKAQELQNVNIINLPNGNSFIIGAQPFSVFQTAIETALKK
ncbi:MAG: thioredoxin domain-containing protein [Minisyncoccia bacterium]